MAKKNDQYLIQRGEIWYFRKRVNGQMIKRSLETSVKLEARRKRDLYLPIPMKSPLDSEVFRQSVPKHCATPVGA